MISFQLSLKHLNKQADQLRHEEISFLELFEKNTKISDMATQVLNEYEVAENMIKNVSSEQDEIISTLDEFENKLEEYSRIHPSEDNSRLRKEISEK